MTWFYSIWDQNSTAFSETPHPVSEVAERFILHQQLKIKMKWCDLKCVSNEPTYKKKVKDGLMMTQFTYCHLHIASPPNPLARCYRQDQHVCNWQRFELSLSNMNDKCWTWTPVRQCTYLTFLYSGIIFNVNANSKFKLTSKFHFPSSFNQYFWKFKVYLEIALGPPWSPLTSPL